MGVQTVRPGGVAGTPLARGRYRDGPGLHDDRPAGQAVLVGRSHGQALLSPSGYPVLQQADLAGGDQGGRAVTRIQRPGGVVLLTLMRLFVPG